MKKIFTFFAAATIFAACSSNTDLETKKDVLLTDTSAMYKSNLNTDISPEQADEAASVAPEKVIRETRIVYVDRTPKAKKIVREAIEHWGFVNMQEMMKMMPQPNMSDMNKMDTNKMNK